MRATAPETALASRGTHSSDLAIGRESNAANPIAHRGHPLARRDPAVVDLELPAMGGRLLLPQFNAADDVVMRRPVAIKVLRAPLADHDPNSVARLEREAGAAAALNDPAVVGSVTPALMTLRGSS